MWGQYSSQSSQEVWLCEFAVGEDAFVFGICNINATVVELYIFNRNEMDTTCW